MTIAETPCLATETVSSTQAARLAGITYRQLDWWARQSIFVPECVGNPGSGHHRTYRMSEVRTLKLLGELSRLGCPLSTLSTVGDSVRSSIAEEGGREWLLVRPNGTIAFCDSPELATTLALSEGMIGLIVNVGKVLTDGDFPIPEEVLSTT